MSDIDDIRRAALKRLREPFPKEAIGKIPKGGVQLDYVGHANVTDRLLDVDPLWSWEPVAHDPDGQPAFDRDPQGKPIGLWIKLTVCGVTRLGFGSCPPNNEAVKELIGDAIRNAAMRFGVALDLWAKEDLASQIGGGSEDSGRTASEPTASTSAAAPVPAKEKSAAPPKDSEPPARPSQTEGSDAPEMGAGTQAGTEVGGSASLADAILNSVDAGFVKINVVLGKAVQMALDSKALPLPSGKGLDRSNLHKLPEPLLKQLAQDLNVPLEAMAV